MYKTGGFEKGVHTGIERFIYVHWITPTHAKIFREEYDFGFEYWDEMRLKILINKENQNDQKAREEQTPSFLHSIAY